MTRVDCLGGGKTEGAPFVLPLEQWHKRRPPEPMVIITEYILFEKPGAKGVFVRSAEQNQCPCCSGGLKVIGSRRRKFVNSAEDTVILVIRRLRCTDCRRVHHELPDILVPYKRYDSRSIEAGLSGDRDLCVGADESTIRRWRGWFRSMAGYLLGCLVSITIRHFGTSVEGVSSLPESALQRVQRYVGDAPGWLARVVRPVANSNLWLHTRSAFCP